MDNYREATPSIPEEHWVKAYWRPAMAWLYMIICLVDFVIFPTISIFMPVFERTVGINSSYVPWQSITLSNGGLVHIAFCTIIGVTTWQQTRERLANL
jgi:hypothetical protein